MFVKMLVVADVSRLLERVLSKKVNASVLLIVPLVIICIFSLMLYKILGIIVVSFTFSLWFSFEVKSSFWRDVSKSWFFKVLLEWNVLFICSSGMKKVIFFENWSKTGVDNNWCEVESWMCPCSVLDSLSMLGLMDDKKLEL